MVALGEYGAATAQDSVDRACQPHRETLHPARKRIRVFGLDEKMDVIGLHREMHDAEPLARGTREAAAQEGESGLPERGQLGTNAQRDVHGMGLSVHGATSMRNR